MERGLLRVGGWGEDGEAASESRGKQKDGEGAAESREENGQGRECEGKNREGTDSEERRVARG